MQRKSILENNYSLSSDINNSEPINILSSTMDSKNINSPRRNNDISAEELIMICETKEFKKRLLDIAIPRKVGNVIGKELQKAKWQAQKWWSQWLFDNIAKNNLDDFRIIRFENDLVTPKEITQILEQVKVAPFIQRLRNICENREIKRNQELPLSQEQDSESESDSLSPERSSSESSKDDLNLPDSNEAEKETKSKQKLIKNISGDNLLPNRIEIKRLSLNSDREREAGILVSEEEKKKDILSISPPSSFNQNLFPSKTSPPGLVFISRFASSEQANSFRYPRVPENNVLHTKNLKYTKLYEYNGVKVEIPYSLDIMLRNRYLGPSSCIDEKIFILGLRYNIIGIDNHYLSVPPEVAKLFKFQLFGSPFNTYNCPYFSAFPKAEDIVGSKGTYFNSPFPAEYDTFIFNPPYDEDVIDLAVTRLIHQMWLRPMTVLCVLPVWDAASQRKIGAIMTDINGNNTTDFEKARKFLPVGRLLTCPYLKEHIIKKKDTDNPVFYDCVNNTKFAPCNTHLILLSNGAPKISMKQVLDAWN
jgi:hypothetical protein